MSAQAIRCPNCKKEICGAHFCFAAVTLSLAQQGPLQVSDILAYSMPPYTVSFPTVMRWFKMTSLFHLRP